MPGQGPSYGTVCSRPYGTPLSGRRDRPGCPEGPTPIPLADDPSAMQTTLGSQCSHDLKLETTVSDQRTDNVTRCISYPI